MTLRACALCSAKRNLRSAPRWWNLQHRVCADRRFLFAVSAAGPCTVARLIGMTSRSGVGDRASVRSRRVLRSDAREQGRAEAVCSRLRCQLQSAFSNPLSSGCRGVLLDRRESEVAARGEHSLHQPAILFVFQ